MACYRTNFNLTFTILVPVDLRQLLKTRFNRLVDCWLFCDAVPTAAVIESNVINFLWDLGYWKGLGRNRAEK